jgi:radical SAM superfamily enzyme YgiQ (UPF0313 family)
MRKVRIVLISTYELGRQPFGLASPAAWLRRDGHEVVSVDLSRAPLPRAAVAEADLIGFFLPMHTATRLFLKAAPRIRELNERAHWCGYGLYAPLNESALREAGVQTILGGEFEPDLTDLARRLSAGDPPAPETRVSMDRLRFLAPEREGLPALASYAQLSWNGSTRRVGYTEASRGCKHRCRHCPVVPVYSGLFRIVQQDTVIEDIRRQVAAGAQHITFGDPDFWNGPGHAMPLVEAMHREWPELSYDVTIKVEHLLGRRDLLPALRRTGCAFITTAVESLDDAVLAKLAKGHTRADFIEALRLTREAGLPLSPTFIPFTPWTTLSGYAGFLDDLAGLGLATQIAPVQLTIRLLIPQGSLMLELAEVRDVAPAFDPASLSYPWKNPDGRVDALWRSVTDAVKSGEKSKLTRGEIFRQVGRLAGASVTEEPLLARTTIPYLTEPWYC